MSHRTAWTTSVLDHFRRHPDARLTPADVQALFGPPPDAIPTAQRLDKIARGSQLRRERKGDEWQYFATRASTEPPKPTFREAGRGAPRVSSIFELAQIHAQGSA